MAKSILGLEIGHNTIKLIEVSKKGSGLLVERFSLLDTPKDCIIEGVMQNIEPIYEVISKEMSKTKYKAKKAVIVIQSNAVIIRNITMPKRTEKVIKQLLAIRPEEYLPVDTSQYQIDFKIIKEFEEQGEVKQEILLVAAPNSIILPMVNLVESLNLTPIQITIPSQALEKVFGDSTSLLEDTKGDILVIDIGGKTTTVTIVAEDHTILTRMIEVGLEVIREALENVLGTSEVHGEDVDYLKELLRPQLEYNIIAELERILQFYYSRFENRPINQTYLIGGGACIKGVKEYIEDALNMDVKILETCTQVSAKQDDFSPNSRLFVNLLGAIKGV